MAAGYKGNAWRPVEVDILAHFPEGGRKVTPADLEKAALAASMAFRASLENRSPAYEIADLEYQVTYSYVQASRSGVA